MILVSVAVKELTTFQRELFKQESAERELKRLFPKRCIERVLFIAPPDADVSMFNYATAKRKRYWSFPPYGVGTIASHLRNDGISVRIINLNHEVLKACTESQNEEEFDFNKSWQIPLSKIVTEFKPDFIGVTCMFTQTNHATMEVCNELRELCPNIPIALGGVHITNCFVNNQLSAVLLEDFKNIDFLFLYEAELAFRHFVGVVNRTVSSRELYQVYFNSSHERLYFSETMTVHGEDLNIIPAHDLMNTEDLSLYGKVGSYYCFQKEDAKFTTVLSNRGCRAQCTFCSVRNFNGMGVRHRSVESVIEELVLLKNRYGIDHVMWLDDDLLKDHERVLRLFNEMVRQKIGMTWDCTNGVIAASCTEEIIRAAAESGCLGLTIGMESGNRQILKEIKKPGTVETFLKAAEVLKKFEQINSRVFLMIGFPGETYRQILDTINVALEMNLDWYNITILQPLPNTPIFDSMVQQGLMKNINFEDIRYNSGPYGKQRKKAEKKRDLLQAEFKNAFSDKDLDSVPVEGCLDDIWAYMNFHLNFKRLFKENRPVKLLQSLKYVQNITDLVAPENAFAMYFCGFLQKKVYGYIDKTIIERLKQRLESSEYWKNRFEDFNLSVDHLVTETFLEDCAV